MSRPFRQGGRFLGLLWLVAAGASLAADPPSGDTLVQAARSGDIKALDDALSGGVDINFKNSYTETALMNAADAGQMETLRALIAHGADMDVLNKDHSTALLFAALMDHEQEGLELVKAGAKCDIAGKNRQTPLLAAVQEKLGVLALALLEKNADPKRRGPVRSNSASLRCRGRRRSTGAGTGKKKRSPRCAEQRGAHSFNGGHPLPPRVPCSCVCFSQGRPERDRSG